MNTIYAGIGSRKTPKPILSIMNQVASKLDDMGYWLFSGGAMGADQAFESGAGQRSTIFTANDATPESIALAAQFHPAWDKCSDYAKRLHGRNMMILLGVKMDRPVNFVICWTPNAKIIGGTGQALRAAKHYGIQVRNLGDPEVLNRSKDWLKRVN